MKKLEKKDRNEEVGRKTKKIKDYESNEEQKDWFFNGIISFLYHSLLVLLFHINRNKSGCFGWFFYPSKTLWRIMNPCSKPNIEQLFTCYIHSPSFSFIKFRIVTFKFYTSLPHSLFNTLYSKNIEKYVSNRIWFAIVNFLEAVIKLPVTSTVGLGVGPDVEDTVSGLERFHLKWAMVMCPATLIYLPLRSQGMIGFSNIINTTPQGP